MRCTTSREFPLPAADVFAVATRLDLMTWMKSRRPVGPVAVEEQLRDGTEFTLTDINAHDRLHPYTVRVTEMSRDPLRFSLTSDDVQFDATLEVLGDEDSCRVTWTVDAGPVPGEHPIDRMVAAIVALIPPLNRKATTEDLAGELRMLEGLCMRHRRPSATGPEGRES